MCHWDEITFSLILQKKVLPPWLLFSYSLVSSVYSSYFNSCLSRRCPNVICVRHHLDFLRHRTSWKTAHLSTKHHHCQWLTNASAMWFLVLAAASVTNCQGLGTLNQLPLSMSYALWYKSKERNYKKRFI